nr:probable disease resistance protein RF45 [Coffea arabica]
MAEPIVSFLLETIGHLLIEEGKFLSGVTEEAKQLHSELKMMRALLKDADEKRHEAEVVKEWVSQSKDLAYEAENMLETHAFRLASRQMARGTRNVIRRYTCIVNECYIRHKVGLEIQNLNARVSNLRRSFQEYGIRAATEREESSSRQQQLRMTYSYVADDEDFVGLEHDIEKLMQVLVNEAEFSGSCGVVSICGMGCSGKTTLARKLYNHSNAKHHFDSFAWVCISQQWQTREILQGILVSFFPERRREIEKWRDDEMVGELLRFQQNRKCLVVLDDIWSTDAWECIKVAFPIRNKGKILLTSRNKDVAMRIGPNGFHHESRLLTDAESWELLQRKALRDGPIQGDGDVHDFEVLGQQMVKFCGGLPLAVVVLGGILATKHSFNEWNVVYRNIKSFLAKGESIEHQGKVHKILGLSYDNLPYKLKPCFLYLSAFYEDEEVPIERLYQLWMAEGMVSAEDQMGEESMMDIAESYLGELAKRCIVQVQQVTVADGETLRSPRKFWSCHLHDLMRDFCIAKAREENFLKVFGYQHGNEVELAGSTSSSTGNIHRHVIYLGDQDASKYAQEGETTKHLRTLLFCATKHGSMTAQLAESQMNMFKMLRSLTIQGVNSPGIENSKNSPKLPIGHLIHLRYLSLRSSKFVMSPSSISRLEHLETLDLSNAKIVWTRNVPLRMRLRYLYLPHDISVQIYASSNLEILEGANLGKVVRNFSESINLQELREYRGELEGIEEIINCVSHSHKLNHVNIWTPVIPKFFGLEKGLALLRQLFRSNLQCLRLEGPLGKLPEYESNFFGNLLELQLRESRLEEDPMATLEKLPNLKTLKFWNHSFNGKEMTCHSGGFPQLRFLLLHHLHQLEKWTVAEGGMANLSCLYICDCERLAMIPQGLRFIEPLKELVIQGMPDEFLNRVRLVDGQQGEDLTKFATFLQ